MEKLLSREKYHEELKNKPINFCQFCNLDSEGDLLIKKTELWSLVLAKSPYSEYHLMLVPKRHFKNFTEVTTQEQNDFNNLLKLVQDKLEKADLKLNDGSEVRQFLYFWRLRKDNYDSVAKVKKTNHFHFHIIPEREHAFDLIINYEAHKTDIRAIKAIFS